MLNAASYPCRLGLQRTSSTAVRCQWLSQRQRHGALHVCHSTTSTGPSPADLLDWVLASGGSLHEPCALAVANLAGRDGGSGWGLKAACDVSAGTKLLDLPSRCHLTYDHATDDKRLLQLIDAVPSELWGAKLALQLLAHRLQGPASPLSAYILNLPIGVPGIPMFFSREAIAAIEYPPVTEQVKKRCKWLYDFSQQTLAKLPGTPADPFGGATIDINAMGWALACVTSRAFRTRGPDRPASCLPLIDMANHSFSPNVEVRPTAAGIGLFAKHKLDAGQPLLLNYGALSNDFLFMDYGFIVPDNPHDRVQLRFGVDLIQAGAMVANVEVDGEPMDELKPAPWQTKLLAELRLMGPGADTEVTFGGPQLVDARLLAAARILFAQSQAEVEGRTLERLGQLAQPLNRRNERCALRALSGCAAFTLSRFSTSVEQDEEALATGTLPRPTQPQQSGQAAAGSHQQQGGGAPSAPSSSGVQPTALTDDMRLAIRFRVEKKRILAAAIQRMGRALQALPKAGVSDHGAGPRKGQSPLAATPKGFGSQKR